MGKLTKIADMIGWTLDENGNYIPNFKASVPEEEITKWGKRRMYYLEKNFPIEFKVMAVNQKQFTDAISHQHEADEREAILKEQFKKKYGLTKEMYTENHDEYCRKERMMLLEIDNIIMEEIICHRI